eukprot:g58897.t1
MKAGEGLHHPSCFLQIRLTRAAFLQIRIPIVNRNFLVLWTFAVSGSGRKEEACIAPLQMSSRSPIKRRPSSFVAALGTEIHSTGSVVSDENGEVLQLKQRSNHSGKARQLLFDSNQKAIASPFQAQENKLANPNSTVKMRRPLSARRNSPNLASPDKEKLSSLSPSLVKSTPTSQPRARSVTASELANDPDLPLKYRSLMIQYHRQTKTLRELKDSHRQIVIQAGVT